MTSYITLCPLSRIAAAAIAACSLVGCNALQERQNIATEAQNDVTTVSAKLEEVRASDARDAVIGREFDAAWLGGKTVKVARKAQLPAALRTPIRYSFSDSPSLLLHAERISKIIGIPVRVTPDALVARGTSTGFGDLNVGTQTGVAKPAALGAMPAPLSQVAPSSSPQQRGYIIDKMSVVGGTYVPIDLLDRISAGFGVGWDFNDRDNSVTISRLVTRTYTVATVLNTQTITNNITKRASTGENSSTGNGTAAQAGSATSSSDVNAKSEATIDVIKNIKAALESTVTPSVGKFAVSTSGIVTVTDTREVHDQVSALIDAENKALGRQVRVRMQVVEITANDTNNLGVDWSWAITNAASKWAGGVYSPVGQATSSGMGQLGIIRNGDQATTRTFIQALATVGKVVIRKDETYSLLNNRPSNITSTESYIYPARSGSASSTNNNSTTVVPSVEPGQLTTGTFLTMLASIQPNGSVVMDFSLDASARGESKTFVSNGVTLEYPPSTANQYKIFGSAPSGETALLAGIDNSQRTSSDRSLDGSLSPLLGGSINNNTSRRVVLVLLTPQIIEGVL
ncbi:hypothetical protein [Comamonas terrigena]|uniref:hypothetical protein n=1 Tax=Comamonas terrigena TaxID=32013 RepID=UPI0028ABEC2C|nr:hypothetical protein [Comamonas terrigena]